VARSAVSDLASRRGGAVYVVGSGDNGQLGLGEELVECARPRLLPAFGDVPVVAVACGGMHTLTLTEDGVAWSWGVNDEGALGRVVRCGDACNPRPC
jgi:regulator of chromosome condensation